MEQPLSKSTGFFILGAAVGAMFMALTTPRRGQEMRDKLMESVRKTKNKANNSMNQIEDEIQKSTQIAGEKLGKSKIIEEK